MDNIYNIYRQLRPKEQNVLKQIASNRSISDAVNVLSLFFPSASKIEIHNLVTRLRAEK